MGSHQAFKNEAEFQQALRQNPTLARLNPDLVIQPVRQEKEIKSAAVIRAGKVLRLELLLPIHVISEANTRQHWSKRAERAAEQQAKVWEEWRKLVGSITLIPPCVIKLTRIGVNKLDDDNLSNAFKATRDSISRILGIDDGSELLKFEYDQTWGHKEYGVKVEFICS